MTTYEGSPMHHAHSVKTKHVFEKKNMLFQFFLTCQHSAYGLKKGWINLVGVIFIFSHFQLGLCISRGTATVINLCCALVLLPLCKKLNQLLYRVLSRLWPGLFFIWLEKAKSFHMTVAITLLVFAGKWYTLNIPISKIYSCDTLMLLARPLRSRNSHDFPMK